MNRLLKFGGFALLAFGGVLAAGRFDAIFVASSSQDLRKMGISLYLEDRPFSGLVYDFHEVFAPARIASFWQGLPHGVEIFWHRNGGRALERHYDSGRPHGVHQAWYENGRMRYYASYAHGLAAGEHWNWAENGQVTEYSRYEQGQELARKTWTFDGKPFHNYVYQDGEKVGLQGEAFCKLRRNLEP